MSITLLAEKVFKTYRDGTREVQVLRGADLEVAAGEMVAVVGPSGSGKSTLLHVLGALDRVDGGRISIGGQDVAALSGSAAAQLRNRSIGFVFQFHQLLPDFTALENVTLPARIAGQGGREARERAAGLLDDVGLGDRLDHFPSQLSGGESQRVALCRALLLEPPLLLADEPTGNLDPESGERVIELLLELQRQRGITAVLVTHNPAIARRCGRILRLEEGVLKAHNF